MYVYVKWYVVKRQLRGINHLCIGVVVRARIVMNRSLKPKQFATLQTYCWLTRMFDHGQTTKDILSITILYHIFNIKDKSNEYTIVIFM